MPVNLDSILAEISPELRAKIAERAAEIDAELELSDLKKLAQTGGRGKPKRRSCLPPSEPRVRAKTATKLLQFAQSFRGPEGAI